MHDNFIGRGAALALLAVGHASCHAQSDPLLTLDDLLNVDANQDGQITLVEAVSDPRVMSVFAEIDVNGDGIISETEWTQATWPVRQLQQNARKDG